MTGTVKSTNKAKGFGFIIDAQGREYFFHRSACKNVEFERLETQQEVTFEEVDTPKGLRAEDVFV